MIKNMKYVHFSSVHIPPDKMWTPDIVLYNKYGWRRHSLSIILSFQRSRKSTDNHFYRCARHAYRKGDLEAASGERRLLITCKLLFRYQSPFVDSSLGFKKFLRRQHAILSLRRTAVSDEVRHVELRRRVSLSHIARCLEFSAKQTLIF